MKKCPLCDGAGIVTRKGENNESVSRRGRIYALRLKGLTLREIGGLLGISANSVLYHLNKDIKFDQIPRMAQEQVVEMYSRK